MKVLLASSVALALMTGAVLAQRAAPTPAGMTKVAPAAGPAGSAVPAPPPPPDADGMAPPPPPPGGPGPMADRGPGGPDGRRAPPPPPPRGAHIDLQRGDLRVNLTCAEGEPTRSCADTAMQMLDRLQAAPRAQ